MKSFKENFPNLKVTYFGIGLNTEIVRPFICANSVNKNCIDKQRVKDWWLKKSSKPKASCQSCSHQAKARNKRVIARELWSEFEKELGLDE